MHKSIHTICIISFALVSLPFVTKAQNESELEGLTRAQVLKYPMISTAMSVVTVTSIGAIDSAEIADVKIPGWFSAIIATQHLPMYKIDKDLGKRYSIAEGGFLAAHYATKTRPSITLLPFNLYLKTAWYSTYDMYKITRSKAKPGLYPDEWRGYGVKELSLASFKWENLSHPIFYIPVGLSLWGAVNTIKDSDCSIFKTKKAYIDGEEMSLGSSVPMVVGINMLTYITTAIGEEALYRGVIYEELKVSYGSRRAKLYDFFIFPAIHVPMDIAAGRDADYITQQFIIRGISTLLFDFAYDKGGLPLSVSLHTWFNMISFTSRWMAEGGTPDPCPEEGNGGNSVSILPPLMFSISIPL
ncbi:MAG: CPBP family intramembrane metalloprotease [Anaerolineales bacterium]|nr:CPBP family intramembrane metalloprotease [Anaerolineales bacterium]